MTIFGGRQRYKATSTRESLSGANLLKQQAAPKSRNTLWDCYQYRHCSCCCMIRAGYANTWYVDNARQLVSLQMRHACVPRRECVSGILLVRTCFRYPAQTRVPTRCKRGRWARSRQSLLVVHELYSGTLWYLALCTVAAMMLYHESYDQNQSYEKVPGFSL